MAFAGSLGRTADDAVATDLPPSHSITAAPAVTPARLGGYPIAFAASVIYSAVDTIDRRSIPATDRRA